MKWTRRIGCTLAALFVIEIFTLFTGLPDPVQIVIVYGYNGIQSVREATADTVARFRRHNPGGPPPDARVVAAANDFGFGLLRRLCTAKPGQNIFFSPYSVSAVTTTCANAADGTTRAAVMKTLRLAPSGLAAANATQRSIREYLADTDPRIQVKTANSLWSDSTVDLNPAFVGLMKADLKSDVESADLHTALGMARLTGWIARNSNASLASVIPPMAREEHIALVNTITFHGKWKDQFKRANTHPDEFHLEDGVIKILPMMSRSGAVQATGGQVQSPSEGLWGYTVACLPYGDGSMSMLIVLPRSDVKAHLSELLPLITAKNVDRWTKHMGSHVGGIVMPRFKVSCRPELDPALREMGLAPAYDPAAADFTAMATSRSGNPIYLSRTIQNAYLEVDEEGTRAGAMTMQRYNTAGMHVPIFVDRPFICLIRDNRTGMILFAGAIYDPSAW
jgi:serpin B